MNDNFDYKYEYTSEQTKKEKKIMSGICLLFTLSAVLSYALVYTIIILLQKNYKNIDISWLTLISSLAITVLSALIFGCSTVKFKKRTLKIRINETMTLKNAVILFCVSISMMFIGALIGNSFSNLIGNIIGIKLNNDVSDFISGTGYLKIIIFPVVLAPIAEETFFRKLLINRTRRFGCGFSIVFSALAFGIFHGNFYQFFYAFFVGMVFGYIYIVYGKLLYTIILHILLNFMGSVIPMVLLDGTNKKINIYEMISGVYNIIFFIVILIGMIFLMKNLIKIIKLFRDETGQKPFSILARTFGFWFLVVVSFSYFAFNIL